MRRAERGQALTEYALAATALSVALFVPFFTDPAGGGRLSVLGLFMRAFDIYLDSFHTVVSLPIP